MQRTAKSLKKGMMRYCSLPRNSDVFKLQRLRQFEIPAWQPPAPIKHAFKADPIVMPARLTIIFRDLDWNTSVPTVDRLKNVPNIPAVVKIGEWAHFFSQIRKEGHAVTLICWAWGDDEAMAMGNSHTTFEAIHGCLQWISNGTKKRE